MDLLRSERIPVLLGESVKKPTYRRLYRACLPVPHPLVDERKTLVVEKPEHKVRVPVGAPPSSHAVPGVAHPGNHEVPPVVRIHEPVERHPLLAENGLSNRYAEVLGDLRLRTLPVVRVNRVPEHHEVGSCLAAARGLDTIPDAPLVRGGAVEDVLTYRKVPYRYLYVLLVSVVHIAEHPHRRGKVCLWIRYEVHWSVGDVGIERGEKRIVLHHLRRSQRLAALRVGNLPQVAHLNLRLAAGVLEPR